MSAGAATPGPALDKARPVAPAMAVPSAPTPVSTVVCTVVCNEYGIQSVTPFRTGEIQVTLGPRKGTEAKEKINKGESHSERHSDQRGKRTLAGNCSFPVTVPAGRY